MLTMYEQITIKTLNKQGVSKTQIAKQLGCHRNTVHEIVKRESPCKQQTRIKPSELDPYKLKIKEWLDQKISRLRMHELLIDEHGFQKGYDALCKYIQKEFPKQI